MSNQQPVQPQQRGLSARMIRTLGGTAILSGFLVVFVFQATESRIADNRRRALERAVFQVLPGARFRQTFAVGPDGEIQHQENDQPQGRQVYAGYDDSGRLVGVAVEASGQGYQDVIRILYGYSPDQQCLIGMTVLDSRETPGLGDKIEKDPQFLKNFECLDVSLNADQTALANPVETVKRGDKTQPWQIDAITGATISSKAIGEMIDESTRVMVPLLVRYIERLQTAPIATIDSNREAGR